MKRINEESKVEEERKKGKGDLNSKKKSANENRSSDAPIKFLLQLHRLNKVKEYVTRGS